MSDVESVGSGPTQTAPASTGFLTGKAAAIAGFALALLTLTQQNAGTQVVSVLWGTFSPTALSTVVSAWAIGNLAMVAVAVLLARRAITSAVAEAWDTHLARATMILASVAGAVSVLSVIVAIVRRATQHY